MRILVTGSNGQLGASVCDALKNTSHTVFAGNRQNMNLEDEMAVKSVILEFLPDIVIHCAAYTNVDKAETDNELCYKINVLATRWISQVCASINSKLIYISTDFVFDGTSEKPYEPQDQPNPINYYGFTKWQGELEVKTLLSDFFIVRTSWVYGYNGDNFVPFVRDNQNLSYAGHPLANKGV
jgi:dTDP-4-dehydrorhamnose reductase